MYMSLAELNAKATLAYQTKSEQQKVLARKEKVAAQLLRSRKVQLFAKQIQRAFGIEMYKSLIKVGAYFRGYSAREVQNSDVLRFVVRVNNTNLLIIYNESDRRLICQYTAYHRSPIPDRQYRSRPSDVDKFGQIFWEAWGEILADMEV